MSAFNRLPTYVGRDALKELLCAWTLAAAGGEGCRLLSVEAGGGLGKTRLLQCFPEIVRATCPEVRVAPIVDLYDFENRSAEAIEARLIAGLATDDAGLWHGFPAAQVEAAFAAYHRAVAETRGERQFGDPERRRGLRLREAFVAGWNHLAAAAPLVMRFDTVETLLDSPAPPGALVHAAQVLSERELVLGWMRTVLPQLRRTLVILSGRPPENGQLPLLTRLEVQGLEAIGVQKIEPFGQAAEIQAYLREHGHQVDTGTADSLLQITAGRPLLLTCWAAAVEPDGAPPFSVGSLPEFEDWLVDSVLDPLSPLSLADQTRAYCLYVLSYARRGLRVGELQALLAHLGLEYDHVVLDQIGELALVKAVAGPGGETLLFLHDEVYQLIDQSGKPDDLGLRGPTLDYLCALSRAQVEHAGELISLLRAMSNHVSYEMRRDVARGGYTSYAIYVERLLRERDVEAALILSDVFWRTLTRRLRRNGRYVQPGLDALRESELSLEAILRDEQVRAVWLLHAQEQHPMALERASALMASFAADGVAFPEDLAAIAALPARSRRLFVSLALAWAVNASRVHLADEHELIGRRCSQVIAVLEDVDGATPDFLLRLQRDSQLGQAHLVRGLVHEQQLRFFEATTDAKAAMRAFRQYQAQGEAAPPDPVAADLVQATHLYASLLALDGALERALQLSAEVLADHGASATPYRQARYYHRHAVLLLRRGGDDAELDELLERAERAAFESGSPRARGLVAHCRGMLAHRRMLARGTPDVGATRCFQDAVPLLQGEPAARIELARDWAAYDIDLAELYADAQNEVAARRHRLLAADLLESELGQRIPPLHAAEFLTLKAAIAPPEQVASLLREAEGQLVPPLPAFAHVIWGRTALLRARRASVEGAQDEAMRQFVLALAHQEAFAPRHYDLEHAQGLARRWAASLPSDERARLLAMPRGQTAGLAAATFLAATPERWDGAWERAMALLRAALA